MPLKILTVAGSDSGGGAGLQADLKTFAAHGTFGMSAVTSVTAQNTLGVFGRVDVPAREVARQIEVVIADLGVDAVKIGMLGSRAIVDAAARALGPVAGTVPIVLDPVAVAGSGDPLLDADAVDALLSELWPLARVVTPNLPEARLLLGEAFPGDAAAAAEMLARRGPAVLLKGGHDPGDPVVDRLAVDGGSLEIRHPRLAGDKVHGTGCTLASALAVRLARGEDLATAARGAIAYVRRAIEGSVRAGGGQRVLLHPPER